MHTVKRLYPGDQQHAKDYPVIFATSYNNQFTVHSGTEAASFYLCVTGGETTHEQHSISFSVYFNTIRYDAVDLRALKKLSR